ncbi:hypothetical protein [Lactococcus petauri]|uniref:hypothetical protein n=1 Tax=Lactococcus petauri TaxID=1940789 RepID=UPI0022E673F3|nr:hypothetical protein [Lactococcus petauri]
MRKDITEGVRKYIMDEIKPNFVAIARQFNADYRTVKAAYERELKKENGLDKVSRNKRKSKLDPYESIIDEKIVIGCTAISIFKFIQKLGFDGGYTIVKSYCKTYKDEKRKKATIRVHHVPAVAAQVDWKEGGCG